MAKNSFIEWTRHTLNIWWGCVGVHAGCDNCYAKDIATSMGKDAWGNDKPRILVKSAWENLLQYQQEAKQKGQVHRVFIGSMMDIFEKPMPVADWHGNLQSYNTGALRERLFKNISNGMYPNLMFLLLTKRPSNINKYIPEAWKENPPVNVMFGTSPVDQLTAVTLIEQLLQVNGKRFLSVEPQLGDITLLPWLVNDQISWVIQGGESIQNKENIARKRPFDLAWARRMKAECEATNTPYFFKQIDKVEQIPNDLMVRQFPLQVFGCALNAVCSNAA